MHASQLHVADSRGDVASELPFKGAWNSGGGSELPLHREMHGLEVSQQEQADDASQNKHLQDLHQRPHGSFFCSHLHRSQHAFTLHRARTLTIHPHPPPDFRRLLSRLKVTQDGLRSRQRPVFCACAIGPRTRRLRMTPNSVFDKGIS